MGRRADTLAVETVAIDSLTPHPRNYRGHPDAQVAEIGKSLDAYGQYKPVVVSSDGVILAGHGVWTARKAQGATDIATVRMGFTADDPRAEKLMVADNELSRMAVDDDRALAALLADIQRTDGLEGTGWDDGGLDALIGEMAASDYVKQHGPIDHTPKDAADQAGAGSAWGAMATSEKVRLLWGDIEVACDYSLYERVKTQLDQVFDDGGSYHGELERILVAGCDACE